MTLTAYKHILKGIQDGVYSPGASLVENDLCTSLSMSRTPIREALHRLGAEGVLEYSRSRGFTVARFSSYKIEQVYEALEGLEGMVSYLVAKDHSDPAFEDVKKAAEGLEKALASQNWDAWIIADHGFHESLYKCCKNTFIMKDVERLNCFAIQVRNTITRFYIDKERSTKDHCNLCKAIEAGDPETARDITQKHCAWIRKEVSQYFKMYLC